MQLPNSLKTPSLMQQLQWVANPVEYLEKASQQYPDIFTGKMVGFGDTVVFVNHPQAIQDILTNDRKKFTAPGEFNLIGKPIFGDSSIAMLSGNAHRRRRQLLMPPFHGERMRSYGQLICNLTEKVFSCIPTGKTFSACVAMQDVALQVILQAIFGLHEGERYQKIQHLLALLLDVFHSPINSSFLMFPFLQKDLGSWSTWGKFLRLRQQIDELLYAEIAERREQCDPNRIDVLSLLMSARDEEGKTLTNEELRNELITLMFASHETTAISMAWALYWIHREPNVRKKLLQELDTLGDSPDSMSIFRLPYLTAVCNESLRIHPVLMLTLPRVVQEQVELLGHSLPTGTVVAGCIYLTHRREDLYPEPTQFKPERFLERQFTPYEFLPFGGGARRCIGEALAMFEMKLVLATILSRYELTSANQEPERLQRRGVSLGPSNGIMMTITGQRVRQESEIVTAATVS